DDVGKLARGANHDVGLGENQRVVSGLTRASRPTRLGLALRASVRRRAQAMEVVKTIIITGGGGHLGQCVARWWAKPETHLVLIDLDAERLETARANLATRGAELTVIATDLAVPDNLKA